MVEGAYQTLAEDLPLPSNVPGAMPNHTLRSVLHCRTLWVLTPTGKTIPAVSDGVVPGPK